MRKIKYINHSIAFTDEEGTIYINEKLKHYDNKLFNRILSHERQHTMGKYTKHDLEIDLQNDIKFTELVRFCCAYPSGWQQFFPITRIDDKLLISWTGIYKLILTAIMVILIAWLAIKIY